MNALYTGLLAVSILLIQCQIGGTRLVFSLPVYALLAVASILSIASFRDEKARPSGVCLSVTALFFIYMLARAAQSPWDYLWWQDFYQMIACLMVYGLCTLFLTKPKYRLAWVATLLVLAVFEFFIGLRQFRYGDNWMPFGFLRGDYGFRASGTLISSIHYAGFLEAVGAFALAVTCWSRWAGWIRALTGYTALLCYAGVAISGSRGGYLSTLVSLAAFAVLSLIIVRKTRPEKLVKVLLIGGVVTAVVLAGTVALMLRSPGLQKRLDMLTNQDLRIMSVVMSDGTKEGKDNPGKHDIRVYNWQAALDQIQVSPTFGTGAGTHLYYGRLFRRPQIQSDPVHAHSDYLEITAEYGIVGAVGMGLFLLVHLGHGWRRFTSILRQELGDLDYYQPVRSDELALVVGALSAVAAYLAHSVVDFNLHIPGNALVFAFIFGILASPRADDQPTPTRLEPVFRLILPVLGIWMLLVGFTKYPAERWYEKARVALRDRRLNESVNYAQHAIAHGTRNPEFWFHLGEARRAMGLAARTAADRQPHMKAAVEAYRRSLAIFPYDEHVLVRLAQALDELGQFAEASKTYQIAIDHDPNLGVLHAYYAQHLFRMGRTDEAHESFKRASQLSSENLRRIVDPGFLDAPVEPHLPVTPP